MKGILKGTAGILDVYDEAEIRKILQASKKVREFSVAITIPPTHDSILHYMNSLTKLGQGIMVLCQLSTKRGGELALSALKAQLKDAIDIIVGESPSLVHACKLFLIDPQNAENKVMITSFSKRLIFAAEQIDLIVRCRNEEGLKISNPGKFKQDLSKQREIGERLSQNALINHSQNSDRNITADTFREFISISNELATSSADCIEMISEHTAKLKGKAVIDNIQENIFELEGISKSKYDDSISNHNMKEALKAIQNGFENIEKLVPKGLVCELLNSFTQLENIKRKDTVVSNVNDSAYGNEEKHLRKNLDAFQKECKKIGTLVRAALDTLKENQNITYQKLDMLNLGIHNLAEAVEAAAVIVFKNPGNQIAKENLELTFNHFNHQIKELDKSLINDDLVFHAVELVSGARNSKI